MRACFSATAEPDVDVTEAIRAAAAAGFGCLELGVSSIESYLAAYPVAVLDAQLSQQRLHIAAISGQVLPVSSDVGAVLAQARFLDLCTHLDALGGGTMGVSTRGLEMDQAVRAVQLLASLAAPFDVRVAVECHTRGPFSPQQAQQVVDAVGRDNVGVALHADLQDGRHALLGSLQALDIRSLEWVRLEGLSADMAVRDGPHTAETGLADVYGWLTSSGFRGHLSMQPPADVPSPGAAAGIVMQILLTLTGQR